MRSLAVLTGLLLGGTALFGGDPVKATVDDILRDPAKFEGKTVVVRAKVAGAVVEGGGKNFRLSVNGRSAEADPDKKDGLKVNFVVPKDQRDRVLKGWTPDTIYTADLTLTVKSGPKGLVWFATVSEVSVKTTEPANLPPTGSVPEKDKRPSPLPANPEAMTLRQLLDTYDPTEADNAVGQQLTKRTKGQPCLVFDKAGAVIGEASEALAKELREGFQPRQNIIYKGEPYKTYKVGDSPNKLYAENPLYPGSALRSDGTCDRTERTWDGVPLATRQMVYLAVTKSGEIKVEKMDDAHALLDKLTGKPADAEKWVKGRYPKAFLLYQELKERGELPSLKLSAIQRPAADAPKPATSPSSPSVPPPSSQP